MRFSNRSRFKQAGMSLIEVLIAVVVLSIGLMGLGSLLMLGMKSTQQAHYKQQAAYFTHNIYERMRSNIPGVIAGRYDTNVYPVNCAALAIADCTSVSCDASQLAEFDLNRVSCGNPDPVSSVTSDGVDDLLINGELEVDCANRDQCAVTVIWDERIEDEVQDANGDGLQARSIDMTVAI